MAEWIIEIKDGKFPIGKWTPLVRCKDCKHYKQSAVADRKMCFRKDVDGIEVCYDFLPYDSCTYGERKGEVESDIDENWYSDEYRRIGEDERDEVENEANRR